MPSGTKWPEVCQENIPPTHHYTAIRSQNWWYKAGWNHAFMPFTPNPDAFIRSGNVSPIFYCPCSSDHWHQQAIFLHTTAAHWLFSLFQAVLCKPSKWWCIKIPVDRQFLECSGPPVWHHQPRHVQSHQNPLSDLYSEFFTSAAPKQHLPAADCYCVPWKI